MSGPSYGRFARIYFGGEEITAAAAALNAAAAAAGVAGQLVGAMVSGNQAVDHADDTSVTKIVLLAANAAAAGNRNVLLIIKCTETFAATTNLPIVEIGEEDGDADKFAKIGHGGTPSTAAANAVMVFSGTLTEEKDLEITVTDGTGGTQAGKLDVFVIALPVTG